MDNQIRVHMSVLPMVALFVFSGLFVATINQVLVGGEGVLKIIIKSFSTALFFAIIDVVATENSDWSRRIARILVTKVL